LCCGIEAVADRVAEQSGPQKPFKINTVEVLRFYKVEAVRRGTLISGRAVARDFVLAAHLAEWVDEATAAVAVAETPSQFDASRRQSKQQIQDFRGRCSIAGRL